MTFHLSNKRLIFTSKEVPLSEKVFASTAEFCSVNFSLSPLLWNYGIAVTFWVLCTCWNFYSFLWYWPACTYKFVRDRSLMKGSTVTSLRYSCKTLKTSKSWIMILVKRNKLTPYGDLAHRGVVEHRNAKSDGLRFDSTWGLRIFSLSHARGKTKKHLSPINKIVSIFLCFCLAIDHCWRRNVIGTGKWHSKRSGVCQ